MRLTNRPLAILALLLTLLAVRPLQAATVPVGVNISFEERGGTFVDAAKTLRPWQAAGGGATLSPEQLDGDGWPLQDAYTVVFDWRPVAEWAGAVDDPDAYRPDVSGVYHLSFHGQATVAITSVDGEITLQNQLYDAATNVTTAQIVVPAGSKSLLALDLSNTRRDAASPLNSGIRDLRLIRPGYDPATTQLFHQPLLDALASADFAVIRTMDLSGANNSEPAYPQLTTWEQRKLTTDATQQPWGDKADGVAWEYVIALANATQKDLWINVPLSASADYVMQLATLLRDTLDPALNVYLESSNELWNQQFSQYDYNAAQARQLFKGKRDVAQIKNHARRTVELVDTFAAVFGAGAINTRIRPVLAWQSSCCLYRFDEALNYINETSGPPANYLTALAGAAYFSDDAASTTASVSELLAAMAADSDAARATRAELDAVAANWGLAYFAYEGGPDSGGGSTTNVANRIRAERDAGMGALLLRNAQANFFDVGGDLYLHYRLTSAYSRYGSWGLTDDVHVPDRNAKFGAIRDLIAGVVDDTPPDAPTALTASATPAGAIDLDWSDSSAADLAGYDIYRDTAPGVSASSANRIASGVATNSYTDTAVAAETTYYYVVSATDLSGNSSTPSNEASATTVPNGGGGSDITASADLPQAGSVSGSYLDTHTADDVYQSIQEQLTRGGRPADRASYLEHQWAFTLPAGHDAATFYIQAHGTPNGEGDTFTFAYSLDGSSFVDMLVVSATSDNDGHQTYILPANISGNVIIRVRDGDQSAGAQSRDTIYIDEMFIRLAP